MSDIEYIEEHVEETIPTTDEQTSSQMGTGSLSSFTTYLASFEEKIADFFNTIESFKQKEEQLSKVIKEAQQELTQIKKQRDKETTKFQKEINTFGPKICKLHFKDKPKKRRTGNSGKSGVNKKQPVPPELKKYLDLEDDVEYSRPEISKMLSVKFQADDFKVKEDNLSYIIINSSKAAKKLGVKKGYKFPAKGYQTFLKPYYDRLKNGTSLDDTLESSGLDASA